MSRWNILAAICAVVVLGCIAGCVPPPPQGYNAASRGSYSGPSLNGRKQIRKVLDRGKIIEMTDRTLWKVDPYDHIDSMLWMAGDEVVVISDREGSVGFDYMIVNSDDQHGAHAKPLRTQSRSASYVPPVYSVPTTQQYSAPLVAPYQPPVQSFPPPAGVGQNPGLLDINPLSPALRSGPTTAPGASPKSKFLAAGFSMNCENTLKF